MFLVSLSFACYEVIPVEWLALLKTIKWMDRAALPNTWGLLDIKAAKMEIFLQ
jgi:hypothetical protein